ESINRGASIDMRSFGSPIDRTSSARLPPEGLYIWHLSRMTTLAHHIHNILRQGQISNMDRFTKVEFTLLPYLVIQEQEADSHINLIAEIILRPELALGEREQ